MSKNFLSITEQVAAHLRAELIRGRWGGSIPGRNNLAEDLGVNRKTVDAALKLLEEEGVLVSQGPRRKRKVVLPQGATTPLRVAMLHYDPDNNQVPYHIELRHLLEEAGHTPFVAEQTLFELKMKLPRVQRLVKKTEADAWVVCAGSREILTWFAEQPSPTFALFGRRDGLPLPSAGPDKPAAMIAVTERLLKLGHQRIALLCMGERRHPGPGTTEQAFLNTLESQGIRTGSFNLPDWDDSPEGLQAILHSLFQLTPPTALILGNPALFAPVQQFLARRGLRVPEEVSLIAADDQPELAWCDPPVSHIAWDARPVVRRIVRWAGNVSRGKRDLRQTLTLATFVEGGTIGPAAKGP
jgi:DNA-binding LacI/PurR family transcriptional regulator/DNA-binding transcriptional regulator YhcF (GntR family)